MSNLLSNLEIGRSALMAQRLNIQVTGSNIANVGTDGYSQRRVDLRADSGQTSEVGIRVSVNGIRRLQNPFLSTLIRQELGTLGQFETYSSGLENLESIFYVSGDASNSTLGKAMEQFWDSFEELSNSPESLEMRNIARERGIYLATTFNDFFARVIEFRDKIREDIKLKIEEINGIAKEIAMLNAKIAAAEESEDETTGLQDARDSLVNKLARLIDTKSSVMQNGMLSVNVGHKPLVHADSYNQLESELVNSDSDYDQVETIVKLKDTETNLTIDRGELKGLMQLSESVVDEYIQDLDQLAASFINEVNQLHKQGTGLDGSTENIFFVPDLSEQEEFESEGMAGRISVSDTIVNDAKKIAASETEEIGESRIATMIAQLREKFTMESGTSTFDEYFQGMVSQIGIQTQKAVEDLEIQDQMVKQLEQRKESLTGVSLDEEAINLVKFQRSYQAAAKYITIIDDMLNTIINQM